MASNEVKGAAAEGRALSRLTRFFIAPTMVNQTLVAEGPEQDQRVLRVLGLLIFLTTIWQATLWSNAAKIMLSADGTWQPAPLAVGILVAVIVSLTDALVFIAASWSSQGLAETERTYEFKLPSTQRDRLKKGALMGGRFLMAVLIGDAMATTAGLIAFEKDINRILDARYKVQNAELLREKALGEDAELAKNKASQARLSALIPSMEEQERTLRALNLDPKVDEGALRLATQRVAGAQAAKAAADRELKAARSGLARAGDWASRRSAQDRVAGAEREFAATARGFEEAQRRLQEQTDARNAEAQRKESLAATRLKEVAERRNDIERQLADLRDGYDRRLANREGTVRKLAEQDPRHIVRDDGLLVRLQALKELSKDEVIARTLLAFDTILILLELAAVMGKTFTLIPMTYATRIAEADLVRAVETAQRLKAAFSGGARTPPSPPVPEIVVEPPPQEPAPPPTTRPLNGSGERPRRHAPRWRPSLQSSDDEPPREH